jgi:diguanylate cyclase (GGDEF)-like protein
MQISDKLNLLQQDELAFLAQKLQEHFSNNRAGAIGNLSNMAVTLALFYAQLSPAIIALVMCGLLAITVWRIALARQLSGLVDSLPSLRALYQRVGISAVLIGSYWGLLIGALFWAASPSQQVFLGILCAGMMGSGTATFRTSGRAANFYVLSMVPGLFLGFMSLASSVIYGALALMFSYVVFLVRTSRVAADSFRTGFYRELELARSNETIKLLLHEYSEQGGDCLFEVDEFGALINISPRLAEMTASEVHYLNGRKFIGLFDDTPERALLSRRLQAREAFKNQIVSGSSHGKPFWWSISAKPSTTGQVAIRGVISDVTAQYQAEQQVSFLAHHDTLTLLPNRFRFNQLLASKMKKSHAVGILFLDLDQFKSVNDTLGHPIGDRLLQSVARKLEECTTEDEFVARLGGDEFAIIVSKGRIEEIDALSAAIIQALSEPVLIDGHSVVIGTSIGVALATDGNVRSDELLRNADLALYSAKSEGRNRMVRFLPGMDEAAQDRRTLEIDLRAALGNGEMVLHYQPLIDVKTGGTTGHEALLRWEHPERGRVMPDEFIAIAEETGLIVPLGEWVIRQAVADLARWPDQMTVAINLSPAQMRSPTLMPTLINALASNQVDASRICLEITESVLMHDNEANLATLHKIRDMGVQIALDDFGTGYSSLNYLRSFPFNKIKIDRCFLNEIEDREDCQAIVRSVVHLARSLGMSTTAEGVEREDQMALLREEGCTEAQGYLFSKAMAIADLPDMSQVSIISVADEVVVPADLLSVVQKKVA